MGKSACPSHSARFTRAAMLTAKTGRLQRPTRRSSLKREPQYNADWKRCPLMGNENFVQQKFRSFEMKVSD
jgi:hypothetical protein